MLHSGLLEYLTDDELLFIVGRELGHIKHGHTRWLSIIAPCGSAIPGLNLLYGHWQRKADYTADRAGLIACGSLDAAVRAILKLAAGPPAMRYASAEEFLKQAHEAEGSQLDRIREWFGTQPHVTSRIRELIQFAASDKYRRIVLAAGPEGERGRPCPRCGALTLNAFRYCVRCGAPLVPPEPEEGKAAAEA